MSAADEEYTSMSLCLELLADLVDASVSEAAARTVSAPPVAEPSGLGDGAVP
jgi:hypothetical protein